MSFRDWDGTAWQDYCIELLRIRYSNHDLVEVPDRHNGDLGLEAFTHNGVAFQCYAAKEPLGVRDLYEHQRDKLTTDLGKLKKNKGDLSKLLQGVSVHRYVYLVHRNDSKELVTHAQTKASEVRQWELPFVRADFAITIETDDHYAAERDSLKAIPTHLVEPTPVDDETLLAWGSDNPGLLEEARRKIGTLGYKGGALDTYLDSLSYQFLLGENGLADLRAKFPTSWASVSQLKSDKERMLALEYPPGFTNSVMDVKAIAQDVAAELQRDIPTVSARLATTLAWSMVADWILRCPLDFEEPAA
jgi:hypothetical protein